MQIYDYNIAGWNVRIQFKEADSISNISLLPSFMPFVRKDAMDDDARLFTLTVDNTLRSLPKSKLEEIRTFDTGNGDTRVDQIVGGGYQFIIRDVFNNDCALLRANDMFSECHCALAGSYGNQRFGLNNVLMLIFAFAGSFHKTMLIHASVVRKGGVAYAFTAKSGTGKSTQVANWLRAVPGCDLLNDDNPVVRVMDDGSVRIFGSPWSGKTPCYRNASARLGGVAHICRAQENRLERLMGLQAFAAYLPSCSSMKWDQQIYNRLIDAVTEVVSVVPICNLHCLPNEESAIVCSKAYEEMEAKG